MSGEESRWRTPARGTIPTGGSGAANGVPCAVRAVCLPTSPRLDAGAARGVAEPGQFTVKSRYPCSGLAPVAVFQCREGFQAALIREGRPPALANAPFSRERS